MPNAQCRSNKGAPGVDGQDFADIEAHGVERWLAELALALRQETYRPEPDQTCVQPRLVWRRFCCAGACFSIGLFRT